MLLGFKRLSVVCYLGLLEGVLSVGGAVCGRSWFVFCSVELGGFCLWGQVSHL